jgi:phage gp29-like protein
MALLDQWGKPVKTAVLTKPQAEAGMTGVRQIWVGSTASGLTPVRLSGILRACDEGDLEEFLILAEEMEERDPHYASVLGIRKRKVSAIEPIVKPASDDPNDVKIAKAVRNRIAEHDGFADLIEDMLDAVGKGFSVTEINWRKTASEWWPDEFVHRPAHWFQPDRETGRELRLRDGSQDGEALDAFKYVRHIAKLKSGLPYRGGVARVAAFSWMCKAYTLKDWMAFVETYGLPLRLGRYGPEATRQDVEALFKAVANIGTDAAAVLPKSMMIDFENGPAANGDKVFENLARYIDEQVSKAVLGQTMTSDNGSSEAQANVHNEVRHDIAAADARAVTGTINRDIVKPYVDLNFGVQADYPRILMKVMEPEDTAAKITSACELMDRGVTFKATELRADLGYSDPTDDDEVVGGLPEKAAEKTALNREQPQQPTDAIDELLRDMPEDWRELADELYAEIESLIDRAESYDDLLASLPEAIRYMPTGLAVETLVKSMFKARAEGDAPRG